MDYLSELKQILDEIQSTERTTIVILRQAEKLSKGNLRLLVSISRKLRDNKVNAKIFSEIIVGLLDTQAFDHYAKIMDYFAEIYPNAEAFQEIVALLHASPMEPHSLTFFADCCDSWKKLNLHPDIISTMFKHGYIKYAGYPKGQSGPYGYFPRNFTMFFSMLSQLDVSNRRVQVAIDDLISAMFDVSVSDPRIITPVLETGVGILSTWADTHAPAEIETAEFIITSLHRVLYDINQFPEDYPDPYHACMQKWHNNHFKTALQDMATKTPEIFDFAYATEVLRTAFDLKIRRPDRFPSAKVLDSVLKGGPGADIKVIIADFDDLAASDNLKIFELAMEHGYSIDYREVGTPEELKDALTRGQSGMVILVAHGSWQSDENFDIALSEKYRQFTSADFRAMFSNQSEMIQIIPKGIFILNSCDGDRGLDNFAISMLPFCPDAGVFLAAKWSSTTELNFEISDGHISLVFDVYGFSEAESDTLLELLSDNVPHVRDLLGNNTVKISRLPPPDTHRRFGGWRAIVPIDNLHGLQNRQIETAA